MNAAEERRAPPAAARESAPPERSAVDRQQQRRLRFIRSNRLSPQEVADHIPDDYDPGPEFDQ